MSSFLSNKFLQYRNAASLNIESDLFCTTCGYNVRGLMFGRNCPECGQQIRQSPGMHDALVSGDWSQRQRTWLGLTLITASLFIVAIARFWLFIVLVLTSMMSAEHIYLWLGLCVSGAWVGGVWLLTPPRMDAQYAPMKWLRLSARWSQLLWLPAYLCWIAASLFYSGTPLGDSLYPWSLMLRGVAGIGALCFAAWLLRLASDAELDDASRRINFCIWMLPIPTLLLVQVPSQVPWIALTLIAMVLLVWCWYVLLLGRAVLVMQRHVSWALRLAADLQHRDTRMMQTRQQLECEIQAQIRPLPQQTRSDVPLDDLE